MIAAGLDPGTKNPGLAVVQYLGPGCWRLLYSPVLHDLGELGQALNNVLGTWSLDACAYESVGWANHAAKQGHGSGRILESVGMLRFAAELADAPCVEIAPATWRKRVSGSGRASKEQVREMLKRRLAGWPSGPVSLNRSDAAAVAMACLMGRRCK